MPRFGNITPQHIPITNIFANLVSDDPFYSGSTDEKALVKIDNDLKKYGYSAISLQSQDFAIKHDIYVNQINQTKIQSLNSLLNNLKSKGIKVVTMDKIPSMITNNSVVVPDWFKINAKWWSENKIPDSDFTKEIHYLIEKEVIKIPTVQKGTPDKKIPDWIKISAGQWSENKIGKEDFVKGLQYMVQNGIA